MKLIMALKKELENDNLGFTPAKISVSEMASFKDSLSEQDRADFTRELTNLGYTIDA